MHALAAPPEVKHDLLNAKEKGEKANDEFQKSCLGEKASKDFYDRQSKLQLKHLVTLEKPKRIKFPERMSF